MQTGLLQCYHSFLTSKETIAFIENFSVTELLFEVATDTERGLEVTKSPKPRETCFFLGHSRQDGMMSAGPFWSEQCVPWLPSFSGKMK